MPHALLVEDEEKFLKPLTEMARQQGYSSSCARSLSEARSMLEHERIDVLLLDTSLPDGRGLDLIEEGCWPDRNTVIVMSEEQDVETVLPSLRRKVRDYLTKPVDLAKVQTHLEVISQVCQGRDGQSEADEPCEPEQANGLGPMLGQSHAMRRLYHMIARVAPTDATVLLVGESGTGKELIAQALHERSARRRNKLIPLNCGAVPENLIESELFGHERGAFTGASQMRRGVFERASGGTLLLDEITEMPADMQVRLLRVLETGCITRVGGEKEIPVDVRVIAATNRQPSEAVKEGRLREDLLYRLSVFPVQVPPLRERGDDVDLLVHHFLEMLNEQSGQQKRLDAGVMRQLKAYPWPGNIRQLKNVIQRAYIMADTRIDLSTLPQPISNTPSHRGNGLHFSVGTSLATAERELIYATLSHYNGDKRKTAKTLGVSLKTLYNRLNAYKQEDCGAGA